MRIRPATTRDARAIARVQVRGWQIGYKGMIPEAYLARLTIEEHTNRWLATLAGVHPMRNLVAEDDDEAIAGWACYGANRSDLPSTTGELAALYVDPARWDEGIGGMLLAQAELGLALAGFERVILWTLDANHRTRSFYENRGWMFDGTQDVHASGATVVRYVKLLSPAVDPEATGAYDSRDEQAQARRVGKAPQGEEEG